MAGRMLVALMCAVIGCARPVTAPGLLDLPRSLPSPLGPVPVLVVDSIRGADSTLNLMGGFDAARRLIYIRRGMAPAAALHVAYHEFCHVWTFDTGLSQLLPPLLLDAICDAWGTSRVAEYLAGRPK